MQENDDAARSMMNRSRRFFRIALFTAALSVGCQRRVAPEPAASEADRKIEYYSRKIASDPKLYPVYVQLAGAYLEKAKQTHDPAYLKEAERALHRSLDIQPSLEAFQTLAALCNHRHRFPEAITWTQRALATSPEDTSMVAASVEAYLALGEGGQAAALLAREEARETDFYLSAARGHWLKSEGRGEEASQAFVRASDAALIQKSNSHAAWGQVQAAGVWLDAGFVDRAEPFLARAAELDPNHVELGIHRAEMFEARGELNEALAVYEALLARAEDGELHVRAFALAKKLGKFADGQIHFEAAQREFQRAIEAGEVYTLGALARLYSQAGVYPDRALELGRRNLIHQRDALARRTLEQAEQNVATKPNP